MMSNFVKCHYERCLSTLKQTDRLNRLWLQRVHKVYNEYGYVTEGRTTGAEVAEKRRKPNEMSPYK